jgi:hypothetical protein
MKRFQSPEHAQRFLFVFESLNAPCRLRRHLLSATAINNYLPKPFNSGDLRLAWLSIHSGGVAVSSEPL